MSGLFIKDMSLPEHCGACPLALLGWGGYRHCFITNNDVSDCDSWYNDRDEDCPMVEREE